MQDILDISEQSTLSANEYAEKYNISRRTVSRYIKQGKLEAVRRTGRTYVVDQKPLETPIKPEPVKQLDNADNWPEQLIRQPDNDAPEPSQLSMQAKTYHRWQSLSIALTVAASITTLATVWMYTTWQNTADALSTSQDTTTALTADLAAATKTITQLQANLFKTMTSATELTADAAAAKTINQSLQETLADTKQQLTAEHQRNDDIEATLIDLSMVYTQLVAEPTVDTVQDATDTP